MKKLLSTIAILGALIGSSYAATSTVTGSIDPIVIGDVFSLTLVTVNTTPDNPNTPANEFAQIFSPGVGQPATGVIAGNLYFGSVDTSNATGIYVNATPTAASGLYSGVAHRAGGHYTETRLYMDNNTSNFTVSLTVGAGTAPLSLIGLTPPANTASQGTSVMHVNSAGLVTGDLAGTTTQFTGNIQNPAVMFAIPNGTPLTLYNSGTPTSPISDAFKALVFLDFLPINIPAGTYGGSSTWTMQSF